MALLRELYHTYLSTGPQCQVVVSLLLYEGKGTERHLGSRMFHSTLIWKWGKQIVNK